MKRLYLVDGSSYFYRAYWGGPRGLASPDGLPTNAIYVFATMIQKVVRRHRPDYLAIVFDAPGKTFRDELFPAYKATRQEMPEDLSRQIPHIKRLPSLFRIRTFEEPGVEADDVIGTLAVRSLNQGIDVVLVTGDKDLMQLVTKQAKDEKSPGITIYDDMKERRIGIDEVKEKFGVGPEAVADVLALMGDKTDNVPGVRGIGEKTAAQLVAAHGSIDALYRNLDAVPERWRKLLAERRADAELSRRLVAIRHDLPIAFRPEDLAPGEPDRDAVIEFCRTMGFRKLLDDLQLDAPRREGISSAGYRLVTDLAELRLLAGALLASPRVSLDLETTDLDAMRAEIVGVALCAVEGEARYVPLRHAYLGAPAQIDPAEALEALRPLIERGRLVGSNLKYDALVLRNAGVAAGPVEFDTMLASYLIDPDKEHGLKSLARDWLRHDMARYEDVAGRGKSQRPFPEVPVEEALAYAGADADVALRLVRPLEDRLRADGLEDLLRDVELPLARVLVDMEAAGVRVDTEQLRQVSSEFGARLRRGLEEIHRDAGEEFNPDSPKQLQRVLFEKLGLRPGRRTKTGFSTDVSVLEELAAEHPLPRRLLEYRQLAKLRSTYVDALPSMVNPRTGRVHTSYNQAVAATGRLSSSDPNLQNIPVRTAEGRLIRRAFVPAEGRVFVGLDYSQIELRILAHLSGDPRLVKAFREDRDVHRATAADVFGIAESEVTDDQRSRAKAINFGIVYGMGSFGLARRLGIGQREAADFIQRYFDRYAGVKKFLDRLLEEARRRGYVTTLLHRRRYVPGVASRNRTNAAAAERIAVNAPIQGTAADLMKVAMIRVAERLRRERLDAPMILQVHDELVLEPREADADRVADAVREEMEGVHPMSVPLKVDVARGPNWAEME